MIFSKILIALSCVGLLYAHAQNAGTHSITVSSAAIQNLYRNCANKVNIDVPDLCSDYNPVCTATEADIQQSTEHKRKFLIIPSGKKCTISVANQTDTSPEPLGDITFNVIEPPKPTIEFTINGQVIRSNSRAGKGAYITLNIVPNPEFAATMTQDARYSFGKIKFIRQNCWVFTTVGEYEASNLVIGENIKIPIPSAAFQSASGTKIYIEISDIYRINFKGEKKVDNRFTLYEKSISVLTN